MRIFLTLFVLAISAAAAHFLVITSLPGFIMGKAQEAIAAQGVPLNVWVATPRQTPQTQRVVRPSPDLAYALCRFDTSSGPVQITAPVGDGYGSVSIFNNQTDNVFVGDLSRGSTFTSVRIEPGSGAASGNIAFVDGPGLALIRRLAPTQAEYEVAAALVNDATCETVD